MTSPPTPPLVGAFRFADVYSDHMVLQREPLRSTFLATGGSVVLRQAVLHDFKWITPSEKELSRLRNLYRPAIY
jgi:hypothetical protein